ncbi:MAG: FMN-binding negative transcriptional regulator [Flavisolibacter sp.]
MYNLPYYKDKDADKILQFVKEHSFGYLIGSHLDIPVATQVPFLIDEHEGKLFLKGHIMRNTDHHKALEKNPNVLCVFSGAHTYVSASWYSEPKTASTWNYMSVHARGKLNFVEEKYLLEILQRTTAHYENNIQSPSLFEKLPDEYVQKLIKAIIAFEIEVTEIDHVFKLSQDRNEKSYSSIVSHLKDKDDGAKEIARQMETRHDTLFKENL